MRTHDLSDVLTDLSDWGTSWGLDLTIADLGDWGAGGSLNLAVGCKDVSKMVEKSKIEIFGSHTDLLDWGTSWCLWLAIRDLRNDASGCLWLSVA